MEKNSKSASFGLGTILFLIFLTLKLAGIGEVATWSWWWVTSPLWIPLVLALVVFAVVGLAAFIAEKYF
jgi:fatty acid desaturase